MINEADSSAWLEVGQAETWKARALGPFLLPSFISFISSGFDKQGPFSMCPKVKAAGRCSLAWAKLLSSVATHVLTPSLSPTGDHQSHFTGWKTEVPPVQGEVAEGDK